MKEETKTCQNCKKEFQIEQEDFKFYEKIKVPPPTFCPECRMQRRLAWRNERFLYRKPDANTGEIIFSAFPSESEIKTVSQEFWSSDKFDAMQYGRSYDFSKPFFEQFHDLMKSVLWPSRWVVNAVNSDYIINTNDAKDCYLVMSSSYVNNCAYSVWIRNTEDSMDLYNVAKSSLCYESTLSHTCSRVFFSTRCESSRILFFCRDMVGCNDCFGCANLDLKSSLCYESTLSHTCSRVFFSTRCERSRSLFFCRDMVGCNDCFGCANLRNKTYCIFNEQFSKEEYEKKIASFNLSSFAQIEEMRRKVSEFWNHFPVKYVSGRQNLNTSGEYIYNSKNVLESYNVQHGEGLRYCQHILQGPAKDS